MAGSEIEIKLLWENGVSFQMTSKRDAGDTKTVVKLDENSQFNHISDSAQTICETFISKELTAIFDEMKG